MVRKERREAQERLLALEEGARGAEAQAKKVRPWEVGEPQTGRAIPFSRKR